MSHSDMHQTPTNQNNPLWSRNYKFWGEFQLQHRGSLSYTRWRVCVFIVLFSCCCSNENYLITEQVENHQFVEAMLSSGRGTDNLCFTTGVLGWNSLKLYHMYLCALIPRLGVSPPSSPLSQDGSSSHASKHEKCNLYPNNSTFA